MKTPDEEVCRVLQVGRPLDEHGSNNWALTRNDALAAIAELERQGRLILGGDVWLDSLGRLSRTGDSWYFEPMSTESDLGNAKASAIKAAGYIRTYPESRDGSVYFELVVE